jgi:hypothetical protein
MGGPLGGERGFKTKEVRTLTTVRGIALASMVLGLAIVTYAKPRTRARAGPHKSRRWKPPGQSIISILRQVLGALIGGLVGPRIGPLPQRRLDETLGLAVGFNRKCLIFNLRHARATAKDL